MRKSNAYEELGEHGKDPEATKYIRNYFKGDAQADKDSKLVKAVEGACLDFADPNSKPYLTRVIYRAFIGDDKDKSIEEINLEVQKQYTEAKERLEKVKG